MEAISDLITLHLQIKEAVSYTLRLQDTFKSLNITIGHIRILHEMFRLSRVEKWETSCAGRVSGVIWICYRWK